MPNFSLKLQLSRRPLHKIGLFFDRYALVLLGLVLSIVSVACFVIFLNNDLGLAYNDARSHLDIGRRVVEGLKPGLAQLGSVWLPLPHLLMVPTIWNDWFWHTGLSGAIQSMISYVVTGIVIFKILRKLGTDKISGIVGAVIFSFNLNILYLQSTAMTELLLIGTMTLAAYELIKWHEDQSLYTLVRTAFWVMLATLIRYDGWFLFLNATFLIVLHTFLYTRGKFSDKFKKSEGLFVLFCTLAGFGIFFWFLWNAAIFKDPLYFAFGSYSAHAQQEQLDQAGVLLTKGHLDVSILTYWYGMVYNSGIITVLVGIIGAIALWTDRRISPALRLASTILITPLIFNIIALYLGHSVLFIQNLNGNTWFNVRYGVMMMPSFAVFIGYLFYRMKKLRFLIAGIMLFVMVFQIGNFDAVTIDDGRVGSSQKNVSEVSGWLHDNAKDTPGYILISAASHDAIIFSTGLPMSKFIHEGTGGYWESATTGPDRWARWIVMRTNDNNDQTFKLINESGQLYKYTLMKSYPFADIYELQPEYWHLLNTTPILGKQK